MTESQKELNENRLRNVGRLKESLPDVWRAVKNLTGEVYKDGALDSKVKRLMSLAVGLGTGCRNCVLTQTMRALECGATREEILETLSVVMSMRGTTGVAESLRVIQLLDELE